MERRDFKKELKHLYRPSTKSVEAIEVPSMNFLMVDGAGDPNTSPAYAQAVEALYAVAYAIKFAVKRGPLAVDYGVMPLEGLWWADDMSDFLTGARDRWQWTMMIMQPEIVDPRAVTEAIEAVAAKKDPPALSKVRFEPFAEGAAAQTMHVGPFADEGPTIERVHEFIAQSGHERTGKHHEIYLTDIRRADPAKWRTIVRQPMS